MKLTDTFGLRFNYDDTTVDGSAIPTGTQVSFYAEFENAAGDSVWYPPLSQDGIPDTPGISFTMGGLNGQLIGLPVGEYTAYVHSVALYPGEDAPMTSQRSPGVPLSLWEPIAPAAPSGLELVSG